MPSIFSSRTKSSVAIKAFISSPAPCSLPTADESRDVGDKLWMNVPNTPPPLPTIPPVPETPSQEGSRKAFCKSTTATEIVALYHGQRETKESVLGFGTRDRVQAEPSMPYRCATASQYSLSQYDDDGTLYASSDRGSRTELIAGASTTAFQPKPIPHATGTDVLSRSMSRYHKNAFDQQSSVFRSNMVAEEKQRPPRSGTSSSLSSQERSTDTNRMTRIRADRAWNFKAQQCFWMHHQTTRINAKDLLDREKMLKRARKEQKERNKRNMFDITWSPRKL